MGGALSIAADNESAEAIGDLLREVSVWEAASSMEALNYPPHLTFAICHHMEPDELWECGQRALADLKTQAVRFRKIRFFETDPLVM